MTTYRLYTNPESAIARDVAAIQAAKKTIDIAAYTLTEPTVIGALQAAAVRGVAIRLYLDRSEISAEAHHDDTGTHLPIHPLLIIPGVQARVKHSIILMHLKSYCVDSGTVRSGSANWSPLGEVAQDNEASWDDDPEKVPQFQTKFEAMWARPDNLSVQQAVDLNTAQGVVPTHGTSHMVQRPGLPPIFQKNPAL
jgi:phosphatidylserine/phosphatidylglycerophosphate/cardiolipin synthase-like enzyme